MAHPARIIPLWLKIAWTALVATIVPVYWVHYGPANFLWFSDIALFLTVAALWTERPLPAGVAAVAVLMPELTWNIDFLIRLIVGHSPVNIAGYMFLPQIPLPVRLLSLFHMPLVPLLIWLVRRLGYDRRSLLATTLLAWIVLPATYLLTDPALNINWAFGLAGSQPGMPPWLHLLLTMLLFPLAVYLPTHLLLRCLTAPAAINRAEPNPPQTDKR